VPFGVRRPLVHAQVLPALSSHKVVGGCVEDRRPSATKGETTAAHTPVTLLPCSDAQHGLGAPTHRRMNTGPHSHTVEWIVVGSPEAARVARQKVVAILARLAEHDGGPEAVTSEPH